MRLTIDVVTIDEDSDRSCQRVKARKPSQEVGDPFLAACVLCRVTKHLGFGGLTSQAKHEVVERKGPKMSTASTISRCAMAMIATLAVIFELSLLEPRHAQALLVNAIVCIGAWNVVTTLIRKRSSLMISKSEWRQSLAEKLRATNPNSRVMACVWLSVIAGNRFGLLSRKSAAAWCAWLEIHGSRLVWDDRLDRMIERDVIASAIHES